MSFLAIYDEEGNLLELIKDYTVASKELSKLGVRFERISANKELSFAADQKEVINAYKEYIDELTKEFNFKSMDVVSLTPENPKNQELRELFTKEHTHSDFEIRIFVDGSGTFYLHPDDKVYVVFCEKGDFISVPAKVEHWFDMGSKAFFKAIRFFSIPDGWVAKPTNSNLPKTIPDHDKIKNLA